jgi:hypothetical protein
LHGEKPLVVSGDEKGKIFCANYLDGQIFGELGSHKESAESIIIKENTAVSSGMDGNINIYDLAQMNLR